MIRRIQSVSTANGEMHGYAGIITDRTKVSFQDRLAEFISTLAGFYAACKCTAGSAEIWCCLDKVHVDPGLPAPNTDIRSSIHATILGRGESGYCHRHLVSVSVIHRPNVLAFGNDRARYRAWLLSQLLSGWKLTVTRGTFGLVPDDLQRMHAWIYQAPSRVYAILVDEPTVKVGTGLPEPERNFVDWGWLVRGPRTD